MAATISGTCVADHRSGTIGAFVIVACNAVIFWEREEEFEVEVTEAKQGIVGFERGQRQHRRG